MQKKSIVICDRWAWRSEYGRKDLHLVSLVHTLSNSQEHRIMHDVRALFMSVSFQHVDGYIVVLTFEPQETHVQLNHYCLHFHPRITQNYALGFSLIICSAQSKNLHNQCTFSESEN